MPDIYEIDRSWKRSITTTPDKPFCSLLNAWDAMFYFNPTYPPAVEGREPGAWVPRIRVQTTSGDDYVFKGLQLSHTTICLDLGIYEATNSNEDGHKRMGLRSDASWSDFALKGIDVSIPKFDSRVTPLFLTEDNVNHYVKGYGVVSNQEIKNELNALITFLNPPYNVPSDHCFRAAGNKRGLKIYPKKSAMVPVNTFEAYKNSPFFMGGPTGDTPINSFNHYRSPAWIATDEQGGPLVKNANIVLSQRDYNFENRYLLDKSGNRDLRYQAWDSALLNPFEQTTFLIPYFALGGSPEGATDTENIRTKLTGGQVFTDDLAVDFSQSPVAQFLLKNSWFYIKCAFYADYVDYRDFAQTLNKEAAVKHRNLIISKDGDYGQTDEGYEEGSEGWKKEYAAKSRRPYAPVTTPTVDYVTEVLANVDNTRNLVSEPGDQEFEKTIKALIKLGLDPEGVVGSVQVEPFEPRTEKPPEESGRATPQTRDEFPPMFFDPSFRKTIESYGGQVPVAIPKDGNMIVDGRIMSPTIDELWSAIKMIAGGRSADPINPSDGAAPINVRDFGGYPLGQGARRVDVSTQLKVKDYPFKKDGIQRVGDPIKIEYNLDVKRGDEPGFSISSWINDPTNIKLNVIRELTGLMNSMVAEGKITQAQYLGQLIDPVSWAGTVNGVFEGKYENQYERTSHVPSLREIEALVKGLRYNFAYLVSILDKSNVWAGPLGQGNGDSEAHNRAAGTVYMLHKDYSGLTTKTGNRPLHNTVFDSSKGEGSPQWLGDLKPAEKWSQGQRVPSWAVYMGADGEWHSSAQAMILAVHSEKW